MIRLGIEPTISDIKRGLSGLVNTWLRNVTAAVKDLYSSKQDTLVSGVNIKTVNSNTLLGAGDLVIAGAGDVTGPAGAVDNNIVLFDGATGKTIKDSGANLSQYVPTTRTINGYDLSANRALVTSDIAESGSLYFTDERVDDRVAVLIQNGTGITWSYNDVANILTPTVSLAAFSTTNLSEGANLYFTDERAQDAVGTILTDTATIDFTYDDATPSITADVKDGSITYAKIQDVSTTDRLLGRSTAGAGDVEEIVCTAAGRALIDDATAAAQRTTLGATTVGGNTFTLANPGAITWLRVNADNTVTARSAADTRTDLSLVVGTNLQAWDPDLDTWSGVVRAAGFDTFAVTPTSANLRALLTDEVGTGLRPVVLLRMLLVYLSLRVYQDSLLVSRHFLQPPRLPT
jgi:hypothetical protein